MAVVEMYVRMYAYGERKTAAGRASRPMCTCLCAHEIVNAPIKVTRYSPAAAPFAGLMLSMVGG